MQRSEFLSSVDRSADARDSIVLRYRQTLRPFLLENLGLELEEKSILAASLQEGSSLSRLGHYRSVEIFVLDESSRMASGTFKSVEACLSVALALSRGGRGIVFESGGNTGAALALYGAAVGLSCYAVVPAQNVPLLPARAFENPLVHLIAVDEPRELKSVAAKLAGELGLVRVPELAWRYAAGMFRGCRIAELMLAEGGEFHWISQTVSAGFGPIGIYRLLRQLRPSLPCWPRLLAVQQAENAPYYARLHGLPTAEAPALAKLLIPTMYDGDPFSYGAFEEFSALIRADGHIVTVGRDEVKARGENSSPDFSIGSLLGDAESGQAGMVGLIGVLKAIDQGAIRPGERVLHALTSGAVARGASAPRVLDGLTRSLAK